MKRLIGIFCVLCSACAAADFAAGAVPQVEARAAEYGVADSLDVMLAEYFGALELESLDVQKSECDFLIETCSDSLVRQEVAKRVYTHYINSPVMGAEAVAIHVFDKWFASGKVKMSDESEYFGARIYADFNRSSLVGMPAPSMTLCDEKGDSLSLYSGIPGRYSVLYFYDTGCPKCLVETMRMPALLGEDFPIDVYAVYAGGDKEAWDGYRQKFHSSGKKSDNTSVTHLWDSEVSSDFQRKYGIIQTPRIFLVDDMGIIRGRGLDVKSLSMMLHDVFDEKKLEYGSEKSAGLFSKVFGSYGDAVTEDSVREVAGYIEEKTLQKSDTLMFRQLTGDLLYYLIPRKGEGVKSGLRFLLDEYILGRDDIWKSKDDSLKVLGAAGMMDELLSMSPVGRKLPRLKVPGVRRNAGGKVKKGRFCIANLGASRNFIMFVTPGCEVCRAEKEAVEKYLDGGFGKGVAVLEVDVDEIMLTEPDLAEKLFGSIDLTSLPMIIETDRKGIVRRKYISLIDEKIWKKRER